MYTHRTATVILTTVILMTCVTNAYGQMGQQWEEYYENLIENEEEEGQDIESGYEILSELAENKIDLNNATREDLEKIIFLSDTQIEEIAEYAYRYGPIRSFGELAMIESLDPERRELLKYFTYLGDGKQQDGFPPLKNILKDGKNELTATARIPCYERRGDRNGYLGYKYKHWLRYVFKYGQYVQAGITASQDSGEPFFSSNNKAGYDYYSFYVSIRKAGILKSAVIGRYRLKFGMGLVMNNDFAFGKTAALSSPNSANTVRAHSSRSEYNYMQGGAATIELVRGLEITPFVSYRKIDATFGDDGSTIRTILKTGYHRTMSEISRKHNATQTAIGGNIRFRWKGIAVGVSSVHTTLDKELRPMSGQQFRRYYPAGKSFTNYGVYYGYLNHRLSIGGETAMDKAGKIATLNRLTWQASPTLAVTALQRFYSYRYASLTSMAFSDIGRVQNESGVYVGTEWTPYSRLTFTAYADIAHHAWPRYRVSNASTTRDYFASLSYKLDNLSFDGRYRIRKRSRDNSENVPIGLTEHRVRLTADYRNGKWCHTLRSDMALCRHTEQSKGWMTMYAATFSTDRVSIYGTAGYFDTDSYDSRIYVYERNVMYNFSFPSFYGNGIRCTLAAKVGLNERLSIMCKAGTTAYFDRKHIASGYQQIEGSSMTDIDFQLRWKF